MLAVKCVQCQFCGFVVEMNGVLAGISEVGRIWFGEVDCEEGE